jgi:hypothetical protein
MNITIDFIGNVTMNKSLGVSTISEDYEFNVLNVANQLEGLANK